MKKIFYSLYAFITSLVVVGVTTQAVSAGEASTQVHNYAQVQSLASGQVFNIAQVKSNTAVASIHNTAQIVSDANAGGSSWIIVLSIGVLASVALYAFYNQEKLKAYFAK